MKHNCKSIIIKQLPTNLPIPRNFINVRLIYTTSLVNFHKNLKWYTLYMRKVDTKWEKCKRFGILKRTYKNCYVHTIYFYDISSFLWHHFDVLGKSDTITQNFWINLLARWMFTSIIWKRCFHSSINFHSLNHHYDLLWLIWW